MKISYEVARGNLETIILHIVQTEPQTAYQLIHNLQQKLGIRYSAGTIYGKLYKLQREGAITDIEDTMPRTTKFTITTQGKQKLQQNKTSLTQMLKILETGT